MKTDNNQPLILVFYLDRELLKQPNIRDLFSKSVQQTLEGKNAIAFFLPTDGEERIECINPIMVKDADMEKINKMVEDISTQFALNEKFEDVPDIDITKD